MYHSHFGTKDLLSSFPKLHASPKRRETYYFLGVVDPIILQILHVIPTCVTILGTSCSSCRTFAFGRCTSMESSISGDSLASIFSFYGTRRAAVFYARATVASGPFGTTLFICGTNVSLDPSRVCVLPWTRTCQAKPLFGGALLVLDANELFPIHRSMVGMSNKMPWVPFDCIFFLPCGFLEIGGLRRTGGFRVMDFTD